MKKIYFTIIATLIMVVIFSFKNNNFSGSISQVWNNLKTASIDTGGTKDMGYVNQTTLIETAWNNLKASSDASYDGTKITDGTKNVYFKYKNSSATTETLNGKGYIIIGTISISSGPNSVQKIRFTK